MLAAGRAPQTQPSLGEGELCGDTEQALQKYPRETLKGRCVTVEHALAYELNCGRGNHLLFAPSPSTSPWRNNHGDVLLAEQVDSGDAQKEASHFPNHQHQFLYGLRFPSGSLGTGSALLRFCSQRPRCGQRKQCEESQCGRGRGINWLISTGEGNRDFSCPQGPMYFPFRLLSLIFHLQFEA